MISQLFLGIRMECAQCHHHPSERWSQDDFYAMAAFFARVRQKGSSEFEQVVFAGGEAEVKHPKSGSAVPPKPPGGPAPAVPDGEDRRVYLARWMTAPENPFFARAMVNRVWALMMGRGLVEPVDDFRVTNPASNGPLLDALARDFAAGGGTVVWINHDIVQVREIADALTYIDRRVLLDGAPADALASGAALELFPTLAIQGRNEARARLS